jgi:uncharacterized cupin superfamily protein
MTKLVSAVLGLVAAMAATGVMAADAKVLHPVKDSAADIAGAIFNRPDAVKHDRNGHSSTDVVTFTSTDSKFQSGMYTASASRFEVKGPKGYGDNEFMLFIKGGVTLTSSDGVVTEVKTGEGVTIPKGWTGVWDTQGYTKFYVTYDPDPKP